MSTDRDSITATFTTTAGVSPGSAPRATGGGGLTPTVTPAPRRGPNDTERRHPWRANAVPRLGPSSSRAVPRWAGVTEGLQRIVGLVEARALVAGGPRNCGAGSR